ncbi:kinase-like protein [Pholiota conissans]|uniref:Kinase-like protein n=1 Tax=Pholiota conissans TaxID=109636 RepID=A0A9P5ZER4_9AGAR|nr:kinase-like protein [Pholiota conissans]
MSYDRFPTWAVRTCGPTSTFQRRAVLKTREEHHSAWSDNSSDSPDSDEWQDDYDQQGHHSLYTDDLPRIQLPISPRSRPYLPSIKKILNHGHERPSFLTLQTLQKREESASRIRVIVCKSLGGKDVYGRGFPKDSLWVLKIHHRSISVSQELEYGANIRLAHAKSDPMNSKEVGLNFLTSCETTVSFGSHSALITPLAMGDLRMYLQQVSANEVPILTAQLALGIGALHQFGIIHGDIKPENVLIDYNKNVKITDFGGCFITFGLPVQANVYFRQEITTKGYGSPERLNSIRVNCMVDWWALGCTLYEMIMKGWYAVHREGGDILLFELHTLRDWVDNYGTYKNFMPSLQLHSPLPSYQSFTLLLGLLNPCPGKRFELRDMVSHPFFTVSEGVSHFDLLKSANASDNAISTLQYAKDFDFCTPASEEMIQPDEPLSDGHRITVSKGSL